LQKKIKITIVFFNDLETAMQPCLSQTHCI